VATSQEQPSGVAPKQSLIRVLIHGYLSFTPKTKGTDAEVVVEGNQSAKCTVQLNDEQQYTINEDNCKPVWSAILGGDVTIELRESKSTATQSIELGALPTTDTIDIQCTNSGGQEASFEKFSRPLSLNPDGRVVVQERVVGSSVKTSTRSYEARDTPASVLKAELENLAKQPVEAKHEVSIGFLQNGVEKAITFKKNDTCYDPSKVFASDDDFNFEQECESTLRPEHRGEAKKPEQAQRRAVRNRNWSYLICVNYTDTASPEIKIYPTKKGADIDAVKYGNHLFSGRDVKVRVWHREGIEIKAELDGETAQLNFIFDGTGDSKVESLKGSTPAAPRILRTPHEHESPGLKSGHPMLKVTGNIKGVSESKTTYAKQLTVTDVYLGAMRLAAAFSLAPLERKYELRDPFQTDNPGKEITISAGDQYGVMSAELVFGYTVFTMPAFEKERKPIFGWFFGLGLVSGSESGLDALKSVHTGPELAIGHDFGIVLDVSLRRTTALRSGYDVGTAVSESEKYSRMGITPAFGVLLNLSPRIWDTFKKAGQ